MFSSTDLGVFSYSFSPYLHLVDFLPQLHAFLGTMGTKLGQDEKVQVYAAIAHVISAMPMERAAESLRTFVLDILKEVHAIGSKPTPTTKEELQNISCKCFDFLLFLSVLSFP